MGEGSTVSADPPATEYPSLEEVTSWTGFRLDDLGATTVGKVEGAYLDASGGRPEWLLTRMGRFGHYTLVPARDAVAGAGRVWVPYTREQIRKAPRIEPKADLVREREEELLRFYGVGGAAGRAAELTEREPGSVTSRPA